MEKLSKENMQQLKDTCTDYVHRANDNNLRSRWCFFFKDDGFFVCVEENTNGRFIEEDKDFSSCVYWVSVT